jgi:hypothetical protein
MSRRVLASDSHRPVDLRASSLRKCWKRGQGLGARLFSPEAVQTDRTRLVGTTAKGGGPRRWHMAVLIAGINAVRHAKLLSDQAARQQTQNVGCRVEAGDLIGIVGVGRTLNAGVSHRQAAGIVDIIVRCLAAARREETLDRGIAVREAVTMAKLLAIHFFTFSLVECRISITLK